ASASGCQCLGHRFTRLLLEKLPLFALSAASCAVTLLAQQIAIAPSTRFSLATRIGNALVSYVTYLGQSLYPVGLALYYPHPQDNGNLPLWQVVAAAVLLAAISAAVFVVRRNYPYLLVGWLWYLGMLVPVIGLVQVGDQAHADRYTYLPHVGLAIMLAWSAQAACHWLGKHGVIGDWSIFRPNDVLAADRPQAENMDLSPFSRPLCATASALVLALLMGLAWRQAGFWRDSETLWNHTLACTTRNATAHNNLGTVLRQSGRIAEALQQFHRALRIRPESAEIYSNLGSAFAISGHTAEALVYCQRAIQIKPDYAEGHYNLGNALFAAGRAPEAIDHFRQAIRLKAEYGAAYNNLAAVLCTSGRTAEAIPEYQHALAIQPDCAEAHYNFGKALLELGRTAEALGHFQNALPLAETAGNGPLAAACRRELER
ncbi:MAG: tetratricopeptide repeat protein, partial [Thermoguttaceae bacterium]